MLDIFQNFSGLNWSEIIVAFATSVLAVLTLLLWRETAKTRRYNQSAEIVVCFEPHDRYANAINLVVENVGAGLARQVSLNILKNKEIRLKNNQNIDFKQNSLFNKKIPNLKSNQVIKTFAFMGHNLLDFNDTEIEIEVCWLGYDNKLQTRKMNIDASMYYGIVYLGHDPLHEIAEAQKKFTTDFRKIVKNNRIQTQITTNAEHKK